MQRTENELPIVEVFLSVQGEGINIGTPSVFLRTYFCNLTCTWCDTKYTWLNQDRSKAGIDYQSMTAEDIVSRVTKFDCKNLVLTGGEPLLHQRPLLPVLSRLKERDMHIEVETNGTVPPSEEMLDVVDLFNVSPKTSNSLVDKRLRLRRVVLEAFVTSQKAWFKFVVRDQHDLLEVESLISDFSMPAERVILMPEGTDSVVLNERGRWLIEICKEKGFRFTPRLHIMLFGNRRGV
ncbi:MAG: 7-carboxy-7-deazaguanine synthase QueE [Nitrososphaerota archaeon]|nr:7-carboxy-7-deazaguanine synthase QueE [Nitrososphaerota archaeon]